MTRRLLLRVKSKLVQWQIAALSSRAGKSCKVELAMAGFNSGECGNYATIRGLRFLVVFEQLCSGRVSRQLLYILLEPSVQNAA